MAAVPPLSFASSQYGGQIGADPLQPGLTLGGVAFLNNEHPGELPFPLASRQAVHEMAGGYREVQDLGTQFEQITWEGTFWDAQAATKVAEISAMETAGKPVDLQWREKRYSVLIAKFTPTVLHAWRIKYSITVTVVADLSGAQSAASTTSVDSQNQALYGTVQSSAAALSALAKRSGITAPPATLGTSVNALGTQLGFAAPLAQAAQNDIAAIQAAVASVHAVIDPYLSTISLAMSVLPAGLIPSALQRAYTLSTDISAAIDLISANAGNGQAIKSITVGGGATLYHLAAQFYGDASLATVLRSANNLPSMVLPNGVTTTLKIPPAPTLSAAA